MTIYTKHISYRVYICHYIQHTVCACMCIYTHAHAPHKERCCTVHRQNDRYTDRVWEGGLSTGEITSSNILKNKNIIKNKK